MNYSELYIPATIKPTENSIFGKIRSSNSSGLPDSITETTKAMENHYMLRVHEMERDNARLEKLLEQRTKMLAEVVATNTKFISILAHDLRSPFSTILGVLEILKENLNNFDINDFEKYVKIASCSANKTLKLLDDLLTWTISQNKAKCFNPVKINLNELLQDEIECINATAKQKQIRLNHSIAPHLNVSADLQMLKTILRNLMSNAIKYTHSGGEINISASGSKQIVIVEISDTGIGMSQEAQRKLFRIDAFQSTIGTNNEKGTGLGLIICKEFVEMHGGRIWVESGSDSHCLDKGSKFCFTMPHYIN
jgi:signal transduction histidine kinase